MAKQQEPVLQEPEFESRESREFEMIDTAIYFTVTRKTGQGKYARQDVLTLPEARELQGKVNAIAKGGSQAMIYAVTADGVSTFVPTYYKPPHERTSPDDIIAPDYLGRRKKIPKRKVLKR